MAHAEPEVGVGMAPSRVQGGPVPGPGVVGPGVDFGRFGGCLWEVFCGRFGRVFHCSGFFLSVSAVEAQHPKLSPRQLNVPCAAST